MGHGSFLLVPVLLRLYDSFMELAGIELEDFMIILVKNISSSQTALDDNTGSTLFWD